VGVVAVVVESMREMEIASQLLESYTTMMTMV
jgi:hypothetical protein